jgi:branched-chain amino acid transport system permease protein
MIISGLIFGITSGILYALMAVGFSLIFGVARVLFMAHGQIYMLGGVFAFYFTQRAGVHYFLAILLIMIITGAIGLLIERFLRPLHGKPIMVMVVTIALSMFISNMTMNIFGERSRGMHSPLSGFTLEIFGITIAAERLLVIAVAIAAVTALHFFIKRTKTGQAVRAVSQDEEAATLQGIDVKRSQSLTFFIACATAGLAGVLIAPIYTVNANAGTPALMKTFVVVVLGGLGSLPGSIVGGLFLGLVESFGQLYIGGPSVLITFGIVILLLIVRPRGLMGRG